MTSLGVTHFGTAMAGAARIYFAGLAKPRQAWVPGTSETSQTPAGIDSRDPSSSTIAAIMYRDPVKAARKIAAALTLKDIRRQRDKLPSPLSAGPRQEVSIR